MWSVVPVLEGNVEKEKRGWGGGGGVGESGVVGLVPKTREGV